MADLVNFFMFLIKEIGESQVGKISSISLRFWLIGSWRQKNMNLPVEAIQWTYQLSEWTSVGIGFVSCKVCLLAMFCSIQPYQWKLLRHQNILFAGSWDPVRATNEAPSISYTIWRPHMRKRMNATQTPISRGYHGYKRNAEAPPVGISLLSAMCL